MQSILFWYRGTMKYVYTKLFRLTTHTNFVSEAMTREAVRI